MSLLARLEELEVSPATLKRDLDYLGDQLGAPRNHDRFLHSRKIGEEQWGQQEELPPLWCIEPASTSGARASTEGLN